MTTGAALRDDIAFGTIDNAFLHAVPIRGTAGVPGVLIDAIPDALCGQANQLLHPVTGACIDVDAAGRARVDGNNFRDIGAIQLQAAPHLSLMEKNPTNVTLGWLQSFPFSGNLIAAYDLCYGPSTHNSAPDPMAVGATCPGALEPVMGARPWTQPHSGARDRREDRADARARRCGSWSAPEAPPAPCRSGRMRWSSFRSVR